MPDMTTNTEPPVLENGTPVRKIKGIPFGGKPCSQCGYTEYAQINGEIDSGRRVSAKHPEGWSHIFDPKQLEVVDEPAEPPADVIRPIAAKFSAAWVSGGEAIWNAEGSEAMSKLLTKMANKLDNGDAHFMPRQQADKEITALRKKVEALEGVGFRARHRLLKEGFMPSDPTIRAINQALQPNGEAE